MSAVDDHNAAYAEELQKQAGFAAGVWKLTEERKILYAQLVCNTEGPVGKAEYAATADDRYVAATSNLASWRKNLAHSEARIKAMEQKWETWHVRAMKHKPSQQPAQQRNQFEDEQPAGDA